MIRRPQIAPTALLALFIYAAAAHLVACNQQGLEAYKEKEAQDVALAAQKKKDIATNEGLLQQVFREQGYRSENSPLRAVFEASTAQSIMVTIMPPKPDVANQNAQSPSTNYPAAATAVNLTVEVLLKGSSSPRTLAGSWKTNEPAVMALIETPESLQRLTLCHPVAAAANAEPSASAEAPAESWPLRGFARIDEKNQVLYVLLISEPGAAPAQPDAEAANAQGAAAGAPAQPLPKARLLGAIYNLTYKSSAQGGERATYALAYTTNGGEFLNYDEAAKKLAEKNRCEAPSTQLSAQPPITVAGGEGQPIHPTPATDTPDSGLTPATPAEAQTSQVPLSVTPVAPESARAADKTARPFSEQVVAPGRPDPRAQAAPQAASPASQVTGQGI